MDIHYLSRVAEATAWSILMVATTVILMAGCRTEAGEETVAAATTVVEATTYTAVGVVKTITPSRSFVVLDHGEITGFMDAMTMPFPVLTTDLLDGIEVGNTVEFSLLVDASGARVTSITLVESSKSTIDTTTLDVLPNDPAFDFTLPTIDNDTFDLSDHRGKIVLVNFWATWCAPCREEIPVFTNAMDEFAESGFTIVGVSVDKDSYDEVVEFAAEFNINYPIVIDDGSLADQYGGDYAIPTTFVVDRAGEVRHRLVGRISENTLNGILSDML